jgi:hypothetical protein
VTLFENQIKTLIETMFGVAEPKSLVTSKWYNKSTLVSCGFVAGICGHQVLAKESDFFNFCPGANHLSSAVNISNLLVMSCRADTGDDYLAKAIYMDCPTKRFHQASASGMFSAEELKHPHLTDENPTPLIVISFLELVLDKLGESND